MGLFSRIFGGKRRCPKCGRRRAKEQDSCPYCTSVLAKPQSIIAPPSAKSGTSDVSPPVIQSPPQRVSAATDGTKQPRFTEKDNLGTRHDTFEHAVTYWMDRMEKQKKSPFVIFTFDTESLAREALLDLPCIHVSNDSGKLICTEVLIFGYFATREGTYEAVICGDDLSHELWTLAKESFTRHRGRRKNDREPERAVAATSPRQSVEIKDVVFLREDRLQDGTVYRIHKAPSAVAAKAWLQQNPVAKPLYYLMVETPDGNYGRDIDGIYKEGA